MYVKREEGHRRALNDIISKQALKGTDGQKRVVLLHPRNLYLKCLNT